MTKIPSVEEGVEEFNKVFPLPRMLALSGGMGVQRDMMNDWLTQALTADRTALLTELRDCELLEERKKYPPDTFLGHRSEFNSGHNTLARAIKAHLDELIKSNNP